MRVYLGRLYIAVKRGVKSPYDYRNYNWKDADVWLNSGDWFCLEIKDNGSKYVGFFELEEVIFRDGDPKEIDIYKKELLIKDILD
jgi:hypothetical protein